MTLETGLTAGFSAAGGAPPYTFSIASGAGAIATPSGIFTAGTAAGAADIIVTDSVGAHVDAVVTIVSGPSIVPAMPAVAIATSQAFQTLVGQPPFQWVLVSGGGSIDGMTGLYSAPAAPGTSVIKVTDALGASSETTVTINDALSVAGPSITMTASSGQRYSFSGIGGGAGYTYSVLSGSGSIDSNGLYTAGTTSGPVKVQVTDRQGSSVTAQVDLVRMRTNGLVRSMVADSNSLYLAGSFSAVNPSMAPSLALLDPINGDIVLRCNLKAGFDGPVHAMLSAGDSLYVGGEFNSYQGAPAHRLAKLDPKTCALDQAFTQAIGLDGTLGGNAGTVKSIALSGSSLYVAGSFSTYRGLPALALAKLDAATGVLDQNFTKSTGFNEEVTALAVTADSVYVGGFFSTYRGVGYPHSLPLKLSTVSGDIDAAFNQVPAINGLILSMAVSGSSLYVAGNFGKVVEKLDLTTGAADTRFAQGGDGPQVNAISLSGNALYVGGYFTSYAGVPVHNLAKVDSSTGIADPAFGLAGGADSGISGIAFSGTSLYIAGAFSTYASIPVSGIAKLDASTGSLDPGFVHQPGLAGGGGSETVVSTADGIFVGGGFTAYGGTPATNLVKLNLGDGTPDPAFLAVGGVDGLIGRMLLTGGALFLAGDFQHYGTASVVGLAKVNAITGALDPIFTQGSGFSAAPADELPTEVFDLALSGSSLYVSGSFANYRGQAVRTLVKLDTTSGNLDTNFTLGTGFTNAQPTSRINPGLSAIAATSNSLYVAGNFTSYRGATAYYIAKLDSQSGTRDPGFVPFTGGLFPTPRFNQLLFAGDALFVGGTNTVYSNSQTFTLLAKLDAATGAVDEPFTQAAQISGSSNFAVPNVASLLMSGSTLYVGGNFALGSVPGSATNLVKLDPVSGVLDTTFSQPAGPNDQVYSLCLANGALFVGGNFTTYRGAPAAYAVQVNVATGLDVNP